MYRSLARWTFRHHWLVIAAWIVALAGFNLLGSAFGSDDSGGFEIPASESASGFDTIDEFFPGAVSTNTGSIVFATDAGVDDPAVVAAMTELFDEVGAIDGVSVVSPYSELGASQISPGGTVAFAQVNLANDIDQGAAADLGDEIASMAPDIDGLQVEIGGAVLGSFEAPSSELIGLAFAIVVLIISFGSVMAMGLPIAVAIAGVGTGGFGVVSVLSGVVSIPDLAPIIGVMIGLGVGIDYALFIVTRYRELAHAGVDAEDATAGAMDTAGRAVLFAGLTVVVSLMGMLLIGLQFVSGLGIAAATTVGVTMIASLTLLPALLGLTHSRIEVTRWRGLIAAGFVALLLLGLGLDVPALAIGGGVFAAATLLVSLAVRPLRARVPHRPPRPLRETLWYRWSHAIQSRPWTFLLAGTAALLVLAAPILDLRFGFSDEGNYAEDTTTRRAYDLIADGFGPGFNGPFVVAVEGTAADQPTVEALAAAIADDPGVASVSPPFPNDPANPQAFIIQVIPTTAPQDAATEDTVHRLRDDVVPPVVEGTGVVANLTGAVPSNIDFTAYLSGRIVVFFAAVLGVSFLLLMTVFRSVLVPLKAVVMNVLSIAAAYGAVVAIFQWGWLGSVFGVEAAPIEPFVPMMLFAIVFGLSMDYEVFLLSRIKEEYDRTHDARNSVADGLAATARVISAAAAIMVVVFGSFLLEDDRIVKLFGVGLALAVLLDATLVRMLLVPATMELLGHRNWWIPRWLDRILPRLNVEGPALEHVAGAARRSADDDVTADDDEREPQPVNR